MELAKKKKTSFARAILLSGGSSGIKQPVYGPSDQLNSQGYSGLINVTSEEG